MLCQFTFKNYKCFRDEATLDMQAATISEHEETLLADNDGEKFLPLAVVYGPNGGGKSTVLEALAFLVSKVMRPIYLLKNAKDIKTIIKAVPFKFDLNSVNEPTGFELFIRTKSAEYRYNLKLQEDVVGYESLSKQNIGGKRAVKLFARDRDGKITVGPALKSLGKLDVSKTMPFLSYLKILKEIASINDVIEWFEQCELVDFDNPFNEFRIVMFKDKETQDTINSILLKIFQEMDIDISDLYYKTDDGKNKIEIFTKHTINGNEYELDLKEESSGTYKLVAFLPLVIHKLKTGGVMIADEMDAKLHPKLIRYIIELFSNPKSNPNQAQLIFTSHDLASMKKEVFRRDEIWFAAKDGEQSSKLYSLVEFRDKEGSSVRKDAIYDKQYLEGRYGADPYLRRCLDWEKEL
jgi:AAA15 family ATPase/GTPase